MSEIPMTIQDYHALGYHMVTNEEPEDDDMPSKYPMTFLQWCQAEARAMKMLPWVDDAIVVRQGGYCAVMALTRGDAQ